MTRVIVCALAALCGVVGGAHAETFPSRPIQWVVAYAAGGGTDILARSIGQQMSERLGVKVVIDNRPGGAGNIATGVVAVAPPDGYTLLMGNVGPIAVNPSLFRSLAHDPQRELTPITQLASAPLIVLVNPSVAARSMGDLIALAKANPGKLSYASAGTGSSNHLAGAMLNMMAGIDLVHVPYRGAGPAMNDVIAGHVSLTISTIPSAMAAVRAGTVRALAVTSAQRLPSLPDLPTVAESGLAGYEVSAWYGVLGPAGMAASLVKRLHDDFVVALRQPEVQARLATEGSFSVGNSPEEFAAYIRAETEKWAKVVKAAKMGVD